MNDEDRAVAQAAYMVQKYCDDSRCSKCVFYNEYYDTCVFDESTPKYWYINEYCKEILKDDII